MTLLLRPYQSTLAADIRATFKHVSRSALLVLGTGGGKTVIFSYIAQQVAAKGKRIVILVHRDELLEQVSNTLTEFNVSHSFVAAGRALDANATVVVASVFSLARRLANSTWQPDLIIVDEAHHATAASTWGRVLAAFPSAYLLGVTATPERLDGRGLGDTFGHLILGPSVRSLVDQGALCDHVIYAPGVDIGKVPKRMGDYAQDELAKAMDKPKITGDAVSHYARICPGVRALVFCVSLEHAAHVAEDFLAAGFKAARIDGGMEKAARRALVADFTSGALQVMTSCDLVSEGFDLPAIECAILLRPTKSLGLYLQQVGRALRPFPGKDRAVILDHANNCHEHGFPDDDREWSLEGRPKRERKAGEKEVSIRTCGECFAALVSTAVDCRYCGYVFPIIPREVKRVDGELSEVDREAARSEIRARIPEARSMGELIALGQAMGYKNAGYWAMKVINGRRAR